MVKSSFYPILLAALLQSLFCQAVTAAYICELIPEHNHAKDSADVLQQNDICPEAEEPIIIDSDEENKDIKSEFTWTENTDAEGKTQIDAGSKFAICMSSSHNSKTAKVGDTVEARLAADIKIGDHIFAAQGSKVNGHVAVSKPARKLMQANMSRKHWMRAGGALGLQFNEIITQEGEHLSLIAAPACEARIVENKAEGRVLGVNAEGEITPPLSAQLKAKSLQSSIQLLGMIGGPFSMPAMPVALGVLGAISPSFAYMHPVGTNVRHRRLKGFAMGAISGLPAGFLLSDSIIRAPECIIKSGDQFLVELKEPLANTNRVYGQIVPSDTKDTDKIITSTTKSMHK